MAFGAARQLLEPMVFSMGAPERSRLLAGPARLGASALGLEGGEAPGDEFAARHGLYWLCANLAGRKPLLITVDDLQWVDGASLAWLLYLGRRAVDLAVLLLVAMREGDPRAGQAAADAVAGDTTSGGCGWLRWGRTAPRPWWAKSWAGRQARSSAWPAGS